MSEHTSIQNAWAAYQEAIQNLYTAPATAGAPTARGAGEISVEQADKRSETVIIQSRF